MNAVLHKPAFGQLVEPATLKIERHLPGPIERVWAFLTDSDLRRLWLASGEMPQKAGAGFEFVWRNDELTDPPGQRPAGFDAEHRMQCRVLEMEAPHRLSITWGAASEVLFELSECDDDVLLCITHRRPPSREVLLNVSAGWHAHLDVLQAKLADTAAAPHWDNFLRLRAEYDRRHPQF